MRLIALLLIFSLLLIEIPVSASDRNTDININISIFTTFDDRDYFNLMYTIADERKSYPSISFERMLSYEKKDLRQNDSIAILCFFTIDFKKVYLELEPYRLKGYSDENEEQLLFDIGVKIHVRDESGKVESIDFPLGNTWLAPMSGALWPSFVANESEAFAFIHKLYDWMEAGNYSIEIVFKDYVSGKEFRKSANFTVRPGRKELVHLNLDFLAVLGEEEEKKLFEKYDEVYRQYRLHEEQVNWEELMAALVEKYGRKEFYENESVNFIFGFTRVFNGFVYWHQSPIRFKGFESEEKRYLVYDLSVNIYVRDSKGRVVFSAEPKNPLIEVLLGLTVLNFKRMGGLPGNYSDFTYKTYEVFRINKRFDPGRYTLELVLKDSVSGKEARKSVEFTVKPVETSWGQKLRDFVDSVRYGVVEVMRRILGLLG
jgi:hypothetical protein